MTLEQQESSVQLKLSIACKPKWRCRFDAIPQKKDCASFSQAATSTAGRRTLGKTRLPRVWVGGSDGGETVVYTGASGKFELTAGKRKVYAVSAEEWRVVSGAEIEPGE
jgi:hypothetical protein